MEFYKHLLCECCSSKCISYLVAILMLVFNVLYGALLCFLGAIGFDIFWAHCSLALLEIIVTILLLYGLLTVSLLPIRLWVYVTLFTSFTNITVSMVIKLASDVTWSYFVIQLFIGIIYFSSAIIIERYSQVSMGEMKNFNTN